MLLRKAGKIHVSSRLLLTDRHGVVQDDITKHVVTATVDLDIDRAVSPLLLRGEFRTAGVIAAYSDHIQPWLRLAFPDGAVVEEPVGLYAVAPPGRRHTSRNTREAFTGHDHTWRLATSKFTTPYSVAAGANVVEAVKAVWRSEGFSDADMEITASSKKLAEAVTWGWDKPVSKLEVAAHLLAAIGYTPQHTKRSGPLRAFPLPDLETAPANKVYTTASGELTAEVREKPDVDLICNVVRVINDRDAANPIVAILENHNPASPVSIENLDEQRIFREVRDANIPDQATADAIALRTLQEGATYDNRVTITTGLDPTRDPHDIYEFDLDQGDGTSVLAGRWRCTGWTIGFSTQNVKMTHTIGKVVPV